MEPERKNKGKQPMLPPPRRGLDPSLYGTVVPTPLPPPVTWPERHYRPMNAPLPPPSGPGGFSGPSGYSGPSGFSGPSPPSGFSGFGGPSGFSGPGGPSPPGGFSGPGGPSPPGGPSHPSGGDRSYHDQTHQDLPHPLSVLADQARRLGGNLPTFYDPVRDTNNSAADSSHHEPPYIATAPRAHGVVLPPAHTFLPPHETSFYNPGSVLNPIPLDSPVLPTVELPEERVGVLDGPMIVTGRKPLNHRDDLKQISMLINQSLHNFALDQASSLTITFLKGLMMTMQKEALGVHVGKTKDGGGRIELFTESYSVALTTNENPELKQRFTPSTGIVEPLAP